MIPRPDVIAIEIGARGEFTTEAADAAALIFALAVAQHPKTTKHLMIGGYDTDQRELWDIPEVVEYVREFVTIAAGLLRLPFEDWKLDDPATAMLAMCCGVGRITYRDPITGIMTFEIGKPS